MEAEGYQNFAVPDMLQGSVCRLLMLQKVDEPVITQWLMLTHSNCYQVPMVPSTTNTYSGRILSFACFINYTRLTVLGLIGVKFLPLTFIICNPKIFHYSSNTMFIPFLAQFFQVSVRICSTILYISSFCSSSKVTSLSSYFLSFLILLVLSY